MRPSSGQRAHLAGRRRPARLHSGASGSPRRTPLQGGKAHPSARAATLGHVRGPHVPWFVSAGAPCTRDLRVVHSDSQIRVLTSGWMSSMLCCTAASSIRRRKPVLKRGPDLHVHAHTRGQRTLYLTDMLAMAACARGVYHKGPSCTAVFPGRLP